MTKFKIKFLSSNRPEHEDNLPDPYVGEFEDYKGRVRDGDGVEFGPEISISAYEWAEDYACHVTDKGSYDIEEVK